jgi:hypothetical protein
MGARFPSSERRCDATVAGLCTSGKDCRNSVTLAGELRRFGRDGCYEPHNGGMVRGQMAAEDRLMVRDPIPEQPDRVEIAMERTAGATVTRKGLTQARAPQPHLVPVALAEQGDPEAESQLRHDPSWRRHLPLAGKLLSSLLDHPLGR